MSYKKALQAIEDKNIEDLIAALAASKLTDKQCIELSILKWEANIYTDSGWSLGATDNTCALCTKYALTCYRGVKKRNKHDCPLAKYGHRCDNSIAYAKAYSGDKTRMLLILKRVYERTHGLWTL